MTTMKTSHTFSILFLINSSRATKGNVELFARFALNGKRANIGLKRKSLFYNEIPRLNTSFTMSLML